MHLRDASSKLPYCCFIMSLERPAGDDLSQMFLDLSLVPFFARSCLGKVPGGAPEVSRQLRVQFGCKLSQIIKKERIKQGKQQIKVTKFQIKMHLVPGIHSITPVSLACVPFFLVALLPAS